MKASTYALKSRLFIRYAREACMCSGLEGGFSLHDIPAKKVSAIGMDNLLAYLTLQVWALKLQIASGCF